MKICEKFKQLFKSSDKNLNDLLKELKEDMMNAKITYEEYEKKCKQLISSLIKEIPSLSKEEKEQKADEISRGFQYWSGVNMDEVLNLAPLIKRKYEITRVYLKDYQDALKK